MTVALRGFEHVVVISSTAAVAESTLWDLRIGEERVHHLVETPWSRVAETA